MKALVAILMLVTMVVFSSCATSGYGCKGRGKLITRVPQ
jgi:hypothetical protein